jgi:hypothetical protein
MLIIGTNIDGNKIFIAKLQKKTKTVNISNLSIESLENDSNVKQFYICSPKSSIVTGLHSKQFLIKQKKIEVKSKIHLKKAIPFQAESMSSLKIQDSIILPMVIKKEKKGFLTSFFISSKTSIQEHISYYKKYAFEPDYVSAIPMALVRFTKSALKSSSSCLIFHLGESLSHLVLMKDNLPLFSYTYSFGTTIIYDVLSKDLKNENNNAVDFAKNLNLKNINQNYYPHLYKELQNIQNQIKKTWFFLEEKKEIPKDLFITGNDEAFLNLKEAFFPKIENYLTIEDYKLKKFAISIGLALDVAAPDDKTLQFRQEDLTPIKHIKKIGSFSLKFICSMILLSSLSLGLTNHFYNLKEKNLLNQLKQFISTDAKILKKEPLSIDAKVISSEIEAIYSKIQNEAKDFPYYFSAPKVSDVIKWINNIPLIENNNIEITDLSYDLLKYPNIKNTKEPYQIKVKLEIATNSVQLARDFHDFLLKENNVIATSKEISWESIDNKTYKTTFYINNAYARQNK